MKKIPFTKSIIMTRAELEEYGVTVGLRVAELQASMDARTCEFLVAAYRDQIAVLMEVSNACADFIGSLDLITDEEKEAKQALIARLQEFVD